MFDATSFLDMSVEGQLDTKAIPCPQGEYAAIAEKVDARQWTGKADPTKSGVVLEVVWSIEDANVREQLGRDKVTVKQGIMLDLTDSGTLDMGKGRNLGLGRLREAINQNQPGQPFSFQNIVGQMAKVTVSHRVDGEDIFAEIKKVARA